MPCVGHASGQRRIDQRQPVLVLKQRNSGLAAGAAAATAYAAHCTDDSPLFVAVWYVIAIAVVTAAGALIGARVLRW